MSDFPIQVERLLSRQDARKDARKKGVAAAQSQASDGAQAGEKAGEGAEIYRFDVSADWLEARDAEASAGLLEIETPFCFNLAAEASGETVQIVGDLQGQVALECSRCGKRYSQPLRESFRLVLESAKTAGASGPNAGQMDPEGEQALAEHGLCLGEDLEAGWYKGPVIGLDDFFGEVIALAIPLQPLCDEACPGVCSHCGAGFAENRCDCEDEKIESPFAVLAALKTKKD